VVKEYVQVPIHVNVIQTIQVHNKIKKGTLCNIPKCFGVAANNISVCSGIGNCTYVDNCVCPPSNYTGKILK
jgi:hypothetical protein